ncbi:MAG: hypothetical protein R3E65_11990 [Steroidobacteraceae bacterium]
MPTAAPRDDELRDAEQHADAGGEEARAPAVLQCWAYKKKRDQRADEGADVDAHVEDREARIAPAAAFRIQLGDDGRDVGLQQPDADDDDHEPRDRTSRASPTATA